LCWKNRTNFAKLKNDLFLTLAYKRGLFFNCPHWRHEGSQQLVWFCLPLSVDERHLWSSTFRNVQSPTLWLFTIIFIQFLKKINYSWYNNATALSCFRLTSEPMAKDKSQHLLWVRNIFSSVDFLLHFFQIRCIVNAALKNRNVSFPNVLQSQELFKENWCKPPQIDYL
jgi:hypothetical protein